MLRSGVDVRLVELSMCGGWVVEEIFSLTLAKPNNRSIILTWPIINLRNICLDRELSSSILKLYQNLKYLL